MNVENYGSIEKVYFTSEDSATANSWSEMDVIKSGSTTGKLFNAISKAIKNIRYLKGQVSASGESISGIQEDIAGIKGSLFDGASGCSIGIDETTPALIITIGDKTYTADLTEVVADSTEDDTDSTEVNAGE